MNTPSLGFESDSSITKYDIASLQLDEAISMFLDGKYICAITLAGAAEGVLAGLLAQRGDPSVVEDSVNQIQVIQKRFGFATLSAKTGKEFYKAWNDARNTIKHHGNNNPDIIIMNLFDEAYWMIERGLANASRLGVRIENEDNYRNWIIQNINL